MRSKGRSVVVEGEGVEVEVEKKKKKGRRDHWRLSALATRSSERKRARSLRFHPLFPSFFRANE